MSLRVKILKGTLAIGAGEAVTYVCSFGRNMILARILAKSDFGIAATFGMVMTILEFSGKLAVSRFVVQDKEGDQPEFIATAHFVQFAASAFSTVCMLIAATPISALFGIEGHRMAFLLLAFFPLLKGLEHLDVSRMERELHFAPSSICYSSPQIVTALLAWPIAVWLPDYRAVLLLMALKGAASTIMTHVMAQTPYRWAVHRAFVIRMLRFGWPLLLNGFLMFGVFQGDQFLVGHYYSMAELGTYAAAATLAMAPSFIFGRILSSLMLPIMSQVQNNPEQFRKRYQTCIQTVTAFSVWYAVATIFAAEFWMRLAYGSKYVGAGIILAWLSASNSFRILRLAPAVAAMAKADSQNQMKSNILRVLGVVPGLWFAAHGKPVWVIAGSGLVGECLACFYSFWRLKNRDGVPWSPNLLAVGLTILAISAAAPSSSLIQGWSMIWSLPTAALIGALVGFATLIIFPDSRRQFFVYVKAARTKFAS